MSNYTTSRNLSRPPLQPIPTNSLSNNLTSTNPGNTQHSTTNNNQLNPSNTFLPSQTFNTARNTLQNTQFQIPNPIQILELILTLILHLQTLLQIHPIHQIPQRDVRAIQYHHLKFLTLKFHNQLT